MLAITRPYRPRSVRFLELWQYEGWTTKLYGISAYGEIPDPSVVDAARSIARSRLPLPAVSADRYGAAIVIAHEGADGNYVLIDWWFGENMLQHHVYAGQGVKPKDFEYVTPSGVGFCVWELAVYTFERQAWVETILARPEQPSLDAYFARRLNAEV